MYFWRLATLGRSGSRPFSCSKKGDVAPFNVNGQRYLEYKNIVDLRSKLTDEIAVLKNEGILTDERRA
jgi:hypothetical protein